jgi:hypothetical protein
MIMHDESVKAQKKPAHFKAIFQHLSGETDETTRISIKIAAVSSSKFEPKTSQITESKNDWGTLVPRIIDENVG